MLVYFDDYVRLASAGTNNETEKIKAIVKAET